MKRSLFLILLSVLSLNLFAQKEANWWYFGSNAGMSFTGSGGAPVVQTNGKMTNSEGVASIANSKGGLLFYTDGEQVYNKKHNIMTNGGSGIGADKKLNGHNSSTQSAVIVQQPVRSNLYWIFTVDQEWGVNGFEYSIVDTSLNGGDGQVTTKNQPILTKAYNNSYAPEKVAAVKHANKVDTWVVNHTGGDNKFYVYLLNAKGLSAPVVSSVGPTWAMTGTGFKGYSKGYMKFTPDGTKLIAAIAGDQSSTGGGYKNNAGRIEIYDFDNLTGTLSNPQVIDKTNIASGVGAISSVYGVEISPNGRFLYISFYLPAYFISGSDDDGNDGIWQLDLLKGNAAAIGGSCVKVVSNTGTKPGGGMQLGPDGKIYLARNGANYLSCITKPNCQGTACTFVDNAISLSTKTSQFGVPTFINTFFNKAEFEWGSNAANLCEGALTKLFVTDSTGIDSAKWNFNDPSTGAKNTAKGFTVYHKFSSAKSYNVFLQLYRKVVSSDCYADTARKKLTIFANPVVDLGKDTVICDGQEVLKVINVTNATYAWSDNSTVPAYSALTKGWVWVDVKVGGCTTRDSLFVDVIQFPKFKLGNDTLFCLGDSVKLTAADGQKYLWSSGDTTASVFAKKSGTIWARSRNAPGCDTYDTVIVKTRALPKVSLGRDSLLCKGDSIILKAKTASKPVTYLWNNSTTDSILKVKTTGIYWARIKDTMCYSTRDTVSITFQTKGALNLGKDTSFCVGGAFTLNAAMAGAKTWKWKDNSTLSTYKATTAGKQWVTVSNGTCSVSDTIDLATYSIPAFTLGNDTTLCEGGKVDKIKSPFPNVEYTWMGSVKNYSFPITSSGKYYVDLRDLPKKVCKSSDTIKVTFKKPTAIDLGRDTSLCIGQTIDLSIAKYTLQTFKWWWDGNTTLKTRKNDPLITKHKVEIFDGVCKSFDSIMVTYRPELFIPELGPDDVLCDNATKDLDITEPNATQYVWKDASGAQVAATPKYTVSAPGGMFVGIISDGFCYKRDSVTINFLVTPKVTLGPDIQVCDGVVPILDASAAAAATYKWNTGASSPTINAPNQAKAEYWVEVANGNCKSSDTIWVYYAIPPIIDFGFTDSVFCDVPNIKYDFSFYSSNTTFTWLNAPPFISGGGKLPAGKIMQEGSFVLVAENKCGTDTAIVSMKLDELGCKLYFPEIFSPNGDGINDVWKPMGEVLSWDELIVYNRWGEIIYKGDPKLGWDGSVKGRSILVPDGVYPITIAYRKATGGYPRQFVKNMILTVVK